jgi:hypothetical protein
VNCSPKQNDQQRFLVTSKERVTKYDRQDRQTDRHICVFPFICSRLIVKQRTIAQDKWDLRSNQQMLNLWRNKHATLWPRYPQIVTNVTLPTPACMINNVATTRNNSVTLASAVSSFTIFFTVTWHRQIMWVHVHTTVKLRGAWNVGKFLTVSRNFSSTEGIQRVSWVLCVSVLQYKTSEWMRPQNR